MLWRLFGWGCMHSTRWSFRCSRAKAAVNSNPRHVVVGIVLLHVLHGTRAEFHPGSSHLVATLKALFY
jgi:hypothetical protein